MSRVGSSNFDLGKSWREYDADIAEEITFGTIDKPRQNLPYSEKIANKNRWGKECVGYYVRQARNQTNEELDLVRQAADGTINDRHYSYVMKSPNGKEYKYPSKIRNYDIVTEVINTYLGERADMPVTTQVVAKGHNSGLNMVDKQFEDMMVSMMEQDFINQISQMGMDVEMQQEEVGNYKSAHAYFYATAKDMRAMDGQDVLEYIYSEQDIVDKRQDMFRDWVVYDRVFSFKEVHNNDVEYNHIPPEGITVFGSSRSRFVEDAQAVARYDRWNLNDVIDHFREELEELRTPEFDPIDYLETKFQYRQEPQGTYSLSENEKMDNNAGRTEFYGYDTDVNLIEIWHVNWKSIKPIQILDYVSMLGEQLQIEVDEDYKLDTDDGDISLRTIHNTDQWEGWLIGDNMFLGIKPVDTNRLNMNNSSECKLLYNGVIKVNSQGKIHSDVKRGIPYQVIYNIVHYQFEKLVNKNKDKIIIIPKTLVPDEKGQDEWDLMYMADATQYMFVDETREGGLTALQNIKVLDTGLGQYIREYYNMLASIKDEYHTSIGFNRQRMADVKASDGKGVTEQAIARSSTITREKFRKFDKLEEKEDQGILDLSRTAYQDGKKASFIASDGFVKSIELDGDDYAGTSFGVFVKDRFAERDKLAQAKEYGYAFAQNNGTASDMIELIDSDNMAYVKNILKKSEDLSRKAQEAMEEQKNQIAQQAIEAETAAKEKESEDKIYVSDTKNETAIKVAKIQAASAALGNEETLQNASDSSAEVLNAFNDADDTLKSRQSDFQERKHSNEMMNKERDRQSKERIAKENKNQYDK